MRNVAAGTNADDDVDPEAEATYWHSRKLESDQRQEMYLQTMAAWFGESHVHAMWKAIPNGCGLTIQHPPDVEDEAVAPSNQTRVSTHSNCAQFWKKIVDIVVRIAAIVRQHRVHAATMCLHFATMPQLSLELKSYLPMTSFFQFELQFLSHLWQEIKLLR
jgi:hypothetical protein